MTGLLLAENPIDIPVHNGHYVKNLENEIPSQRD